MVGKVVKMTILRVVDRVTGAMLGLLIGMIIASLVITVALELPTQPQFRKDVVRSSMVLFLRPVAGQLFDWLAAHGPKAKEFEEIFRNAREV